MRTRPLSRYSLSAPERVGVRLQKTPLLPLYSLSAPERVGVRLQWPCLLLFGTLLMACSAEKPQTSVEKLSTPIVQVADIDEATKAELVNIAETYLGDHNFEEASVQFVPKEKASEQECFTANGKKGILVSGKDYWAVSLHRQKKRKGRVILGGVTIVFVDRHSKEVICILGLK